MNRVRSTISAMCGILSTLAPIYCLGEDRLVRHFDVRTKTDSDEAKYFIVVCARGAEIEFVEQKLDIGPGHVWVLFAKDDPAKAACVLDKSFGFWPDGKPTLLDATPGVVIDELLDPTKASNQGKMTHRVILQVSQEQYNAAFQAVEGTRAVKPPYHVLFQNCGHFSMVVLRAISLDVPYQPAELPTTYLERVSKTIGDKYGPAR